MILKPENPEYLKYTNQADQLMGVWEAAGAPLLRTVCECAVGPFSLVAGFTNKCERLLLIEPDPVMAIHVRVDHPTADVVEVAIADGEGYANLRKLKARSYIKGIGWAPVFKPQHSSMINNADKVRVKTVSFGQIDDGRIDLLNLDCEGSEWFVLKNMVSRPAIIQIELYLENVHYTAIEHWIQQNGYRTHRAWGRANRILFSDAIS